MKIVQVVNFFLPDNVGGTEVYVKNLSTKLLLHPIEVVILRPDYWGKADYQYEGIPVIFYSENPKSTTKQIKGFEAPDGILNFKQALQKINPDIVHFHEITGSNGITLYHIEVAKQLGLKVILTFHLSHYTCKTGNLIFKQKEICDGRIDTRRCSECYLQSRGVNKFYSIIIPISKLLNDLKLKPNHWRPRIGNLLGVTNQINEVKKGLNFLVKTCDRLVSITEWYKNVLILNGVPENKISVIKQGHYFHPNPQQVLIENRKDSSLKIVFFGRITRFKGLHILLEALNQLKCNNITLDIYGQKGDDEYFELCQKMSSDNKNINFQGVVKETMVVEIMKNYDILALCSTFSEMSPLVIQEAFAAGIPVIASKVYGNSEQIVHNENGLLFEFKSVQSLKVQLKRLLTEPNLLEILKLNIKTPKDFKQIKEEYMDLYEGLLQMNH